MTNTLIDKLNQTQTFKIFDDIGELLIRRDDVISIIRQHFASPELVESVARSLAIRNKSVLVNSGDVRIDANHIADAKTAIEAVMGDTRRAENGSCAQETGAAHTNDSAPTLESGVINTPANGELIGYAESERSAALESAANAEAMVDEQDCNGSWKHDGSNYYFDPANPVKVSLRECVTAINELYRAGGSGLDSIAIAILDHLKSKGVQIDVRD